ncbi:putative oxidoreductase [Streptococcus sp. DD11]|uniref:ferredoxin reductase family protein n=1 Tax=Streptococcus sp. DD11 TaxID=1777879 RepID=UPI000797F859|nr:ferric reductase-like transmembrane domain-containing protein [Streptococcus sp. DD11]KXT84532.1 putative oxidoreductase [Streptococcus sp. DD11]
MKSIKGIALIAVSIIITVFAWAAAGMTNFIVPGLALTTLSLTFLLATRNALLEKWFHGIEKMYFYHKFTAIFSVILLALHNVAMGGSIWGSHLAAQLGNVGIYLFISIVAMAYIGKRIKYEVWRWIHRVVYLAYIFGLFHAYMLTGGQLLTPSLLSLVVGLYAVIGLASGFYIIFLYQTLAFKHLGKILQVKRLNHDTVELKIQLSQKLDYQYGQFAFIKIFQEGFEKAPHPFSISGGHDNIVYFTIKNSGDHTQKLYEQIKEGTKVTIDRAYGHMILEEGQAKQMWIAGGIGITPFISYIRENPALDRQVSFYYAYTGQENAVYLDLLQDYAAKNPLLDLHLVDSKTQGYLDFSDYPLDNDTTVFMCGPVKMMDKFAEDFKKNNPKADLVYEGFKFK